MLVGAAGVFAPPREFGGECIRASCGKDGAVVAVADTVFTTGAFAHDARQSAIERLRDDEAEALFERRQDEHTAGAHTLG